MPSPSLSKFALENFRRVNACHPIAIPVFREFLWRIAMEGIYVRIPDDGYKRTSELQKALYQKKPPVTHVLCPYSWHCHGLAIDLIVLKKIGPLMYEYNPSNKLWNLWMVRQYEIIANIATNLGITWGYAIWGEDKPHFQWDKGCTIQEFIDGRELIPATFTKKDMPIVLQRARKRLRERGIEC